MDCIFKHALNNGLELVETIVIGRLTLVMRWWSSADMAAHWYMLGIGGPVCNLVMLHVLSFLFLVLLSMLDGSGVLCFTAV